jgi:large subunit ribosomal protein L22
MRPAPQGRGYRVRKRSNHITLIVDIKNKFIPEEVIEEAKEDQEENVAETQGTKKKKSAKPKKAAAKKAAPKKKAATKKATKKNK